MTAGGATTEAIAGLPSLHDRYHVAEELGRGGFGVVQRGKARDGSGEVAIKLPRFDAEMVEPARILREAALLSKLRHPHLVDFLGLYQTVSGQLALVYELVRGPSLAELIEGRPLEPQRALGLLAGIAEGLQHLHDADLVHRDLKSENVLIAAQLTPKLLDFGLLRPTSPGATLTATGVIAGTPAFSAPEIFEGEPATRRPDLYSLGCMAYEALYGAVPYPGGIIEVMHAHKMGKPPTIPGDAGHLPPGLKAAFDEILARDPAARPSRAEDVVARLRAAFAGVPDPSEHTTRPLASSRQLAAPATSAPRPFPWKLPALGLAAIALFTWAMQRPSTAPPVPGAGLPDGPLGAPPPISPVPGLPHDFPARYGASLRSLETARLIGLTVEAPSPENEAAPLALEEPLAWGRLRRSSPEVRAFDTWLAGGGRPHHLPPAWLEELRAHDRRYQERNLPPTPAPLFPHLDLAPASEAVPLAPLVEAWPELGSKLVSMRLPPEATGWLGTAYREAAQAFLQSQRAEADWRDLVASGVSRLGFPMPLGLRAAQSFGVAQYSKYLDGVWEGQDRDTRAEFARALLPTSQAIHRATVALARATSSAPPDRRGGVARLAYLAMHRLGGVASKSYLATLMPGEQIPRFHGPAYRLLASLPADHFQSELLADIEGLRGLHHLMVGLDEITTSTPPGVAARLRGEFLVEAMKKPGRANRGARARVLPALRSGSIGDWVTHGGTGVSRLASALADGRFEADLDPADLERIVTVMRALDQQHPGKVSPEVLAALETR